jgi:hypothetical protein
MKQYEVVINTLERLGGVATLGQLYQNVDVTNWKTKTPFASIRRIVQDKRFFFKIKTGLWALNSYKEKLSQLIPFDKTKSKEEKEVFNHSYYQGLLVEIGNFKGYQTFIPNQDKNKKFLTKTLGKVITLQKIYSFTFPEVMRRAQTVDTIWFNDRKFPFAFFEVEHSTEFQNSLGKYFDLQDFNSKFYIVAHSSKTRYFEQIINRDIFKEIKARVNFINYETVSDWHTKSSELFEVQRKISL